MNTGWEPADYDEGWQMELPGNASAWIYRPTENGRRLNYFVVCIHFPDDPARICSARIDSEDPDTILAEATHFLRSAGMIAEDVAEDCGESTSPTQLRLLL
jgi:hypothetical protein